MVNDGHYFTFNNSECKTIWVKVAAVEQLRTVKYIGLLLLAGVYRSNTKSASQSPLQSEHGVRTEKYFPIHVQESLSWYFSMFAFRQSSNESWEAVSWQAVIFARNDEYAKQMRVKLQAISELRWMNKVDEQFVTYRGRSGFKVHVHCTRSSVFLVSKPKKYGINVWVCCDVANSYCIHW